MKTVSKNIIIRNSPEKVFSYMDNLGNTGMHMMQSSSMMMGSKLKLELLSENATGLNAKFRWYGNMMGIKMDFTVDVTKWIKDKEKVWETVGDAKMIILGWYQMRLQLTPITEGTKAELSIAYTYPKKILGKILTFFLAQWYANWCLKSMLSNSKQSLET